MEVLPSVCYNRHRYCITALSPELHWTLIRNAGGECQLFILFHVDSLLNLLGLTKMCNVFLCDVHV